MLQNTGEWQVISEAWSWITYTFHTKGSSSSPTQLHQRILQPLQNHLRCHLNIFSRTLHIINTLPSTLKPNSTLQPNSSLQPNSTIYSSHSTSGISPKPSLKPLEAGTHAKTSCRRPHRSVGPTTGTQLPEEDGKKRKKLQIFDLWRHSIYQLR